MKGGFLLGLDWGGGGVRALAVSVESGACVVRRRALAPLEIPDTGGFGWSVDLEGGLRAFGEAAREALEAAGGTADRVLGVAATSVRFGHVVLGPGGALLDIASNRDARAAGEAFRLGAEHGAALAERSGHWPQPILAAPRLLRLRACEPRLADPAARLLSLGDWIAWRLTGEAATDRSGASQTGLFDVAAGAWLEDWIARLGLPRALFPAVGLSGERLGALRPEAAEALGLRAGTPVALGGSDSACALLGAGVLEAGARLVIAGTTAPVLAVADRARFDPRLFTECHALAGRWMIDSNAGPAGDALDWLAAWLEPGPGPAVARLLARAADEEPGAGGMLSSFGAQVLDARSLRLPVGSLTASPLFHANGEATRGAAARAAVEGIALALCGNLAQLAEAVGPASSLAATGGLTRSASFCRLLADATGTPVSVSSTPDATALGAALCAGVAAGLFGSLGEAATALVGPARRFEPDAARAARYAALQAEARELEAVRAPADALAGRLALQGFGARAARRVPSPAQARRVRILATAELEAAGLDALGRLGEVEHASFRARRAAALGARARARPRRPRGVRDRGRPRRRRLARRAPRAARRRELPRRRGERRRRGLHGPRHSGAPRARAQRRGRRRPDPRLPADARPEAPGRRGIPARRRDRGRRHGAHGAGLHRVPGPRARAQDGGPRRLRRGGARRRAPAARLRRARPRPRSRSSTPRRSRSKAARPRRSTSCSRERLREPARAGRPTRRGG